MKSVTRVAKALDQISDVNIKMVISDLFTLGLYLREAGLEQQGYKVCSQALDALPIGEVVKSDVLRNLDSDHYKLALSFKPHIEVLHLLEASTAKQGE
ncbi:hypothetical protein BH09VER1_BH09VER1_26260 [soil metagenome]